MSFSRSAASASSEASVPPCSGADGVLLEDDEALASKVDEALTVLREYETREGTQAPN